MEPQSREDAKRLSRREFFWEITKCAAAAGLLLEGLDTFPGLSTPREAEADAQKGYLGVQPARYWKQLSGDKARCELCPRRCEVDERERGYCGVRENRNGKYVTLVYGNPCVVHSDPIEKKPVLHALPGSRVLTLATAGCNLNCKYCQNWQISQTRPEQTKNFQLSPQQVIDAARSAGKPFIAFDCTEPVVFYEYVFDTAKLARKHGIRTLVATAGYINPEPLKDLCPHVDMFKVDFKAITDPFYRDVCRGKLRPVQEAMKIIKREGVWMELVNLVIPGLNDDFSEIRQMCTWIVNTLGPDVPITFSRFEPMYQLANLQPTPIQTVEKAREIALATGIRFAYLGNIPGALTGKNTYCPKCGKLLIQRIVYEIRANNVRSGKCRFCGEAIPGIWS